MVVLLGLVGLAATLIRWPSASPAPGVGARSTSGPGHADWPETPYPNARPGVEYIGDGACARCHAEIARSYARHPMGRSLRPIAEAIADGDPPSPVPRAFEAGGLAYAIEARGDRVVHVEARRDARGEEVARNEAEVRYVVGSGRRAYSFIVERGDGFLFESPITWYSRERTWDLSPGFELDNLHFERPIRPACLFCHANRAEAVEGSENHYRPPILRGHAIGCERCHGPGALHARRPIVDDGQPPTIVNPARLEPGLRESVCQQCHLQGDARLIRAGRSLADYRPGLPLEEFFAVFFQADKVNEKRFVGQVEQMRDSRCFRASRGRMGCISCHDPHRIPEPSERVAYYRGRCLSCHEQGDGATSAARAMSPPAPGSRPGSLLLRAREGIECQIPDSRFQKPGPLGFVGLHSSRIPDSGFQRHGPLRSLGLHSSHTNPLMFSGFREGEAPSETATGPARTEPRPPDPIGIHQRLRKSGLWNPLSVLDLYLSGIRNLESGIGPPTNPQHDDGGATAPPCSLPRADRVGKGTIDSCIDCHMPRAANTRIPHTSTSDHRIPRLADREGASRPSTSEEPGSAGSTAAGAVGEGGLVAFFDAGPGRRGDDRRARDLGVALSQASAKLGPGGDADRRAVALLEPWLAGAGRRDPDAWQAAGRSLWRLGRRQEALAAAQRGSSESPGHEVLLIDLATRAAQLGKNDLARSCADRLIAMNPWRADYHHVAALIGSARGSWAEVIRECRATIRLDAHDAEIRLLLVRALLRAGEPRAARAEFEILLRSDPGRADALRRWFASVESSTVPQESVRP